METELDEKYTKRMDDLDLRDRVETYAAAAMAR